MEALEELFDKCRFCFKPMKSNTQGLEIDENLVHFFEVLTKLKVFFIDH